MKLKFKKGLVLSVICAMVLGMGIDASAEEVTTDLMDMYNMVNNFRQGSDTWYKAPDGTTMNCSNLPTLTYSSELQTLAMTRANELATSYSHTRPDGSTVISVEGVNAENIAAGQTTAEGAFTDWLETNDAFDGQGHRRNMLGIMYSGDSLLDYSTTTIGVGHVVVDGMHYWVQLFGGQTNYDTSANVKAEGSGSNTSGGTTGGTTEQPDPPGETTGQPDPPEETTEQPDPPGGTTEQPDPPGETTEQPVKPGQVEPPTPGKPGSTTKPGISGGSGSSGSSDSSGSTSTPEYAIISGAGSVWTKGSNEPLIITANGDFSKFVSIAIDGVIVDSSNYEAWSGSTVVSLKPAFVDSLSVGEHTYRVNYTDGAVETTFKVDGAEATSSQAANSATGNKAPQTGDTTTIMMAMFMMLVSVAGIALSLKMRKRA